MRCVVMSITTRTSDFLFLLEELSIINHCLPFLKETSVCFVKSSLRDLLEGFFKYAL